MCSHCRSTEDGPLSAQLHSVSLEESVASRPRANQDKELVCFPAITTFVERHAVNYKSIHAENHPFESLPTEILDTILACVAVSHTCLQHDVLSPHIFKARLLNKRITWIIDRFLHDHKIFDEHHHKTLPASTRQLNNFIAASRNEDLADSLTELYLPIQLQTTDLETAKTWQKRFSALPDRPRHTKWAYLYETHPPYARRLAQKEAMMRALLRRDKAGTLILRSCLPLFRNLRSLMVRTIPSPSMRLWEGHSPCASNVQKMWVGDNYTPLTTLLSLLSTASVPLKFLSITGLGPALLEDAFTRLLPTWSVLSNIETLSVTLLENEDYLEVPADLLVAFLSSFHSLKHLELFGCAIDRRGSVEYCVEQFIEIYAVRVRNYLESIKLRSVTCYGWALLKCMKEHEATLRSVHFDDVELADKKWWDLVTYMRARTESGQPWNRVVLRQSKDKWGDGLDPFHDPTHATEIAEIVARYGDGEGYNVARMELSKYVTHVPSGKGGSSSSEGDGSDSDSEGTEEEGKYDPDYN